MTSLQTTHRAHLSHRPTLLALALLLASAGTACAGRTALGRRPVGSGSVGAASAEAPLVVHQPITPGTSDAVFGRLVERLQERGYRVASCDAALGAVTTTTTELDAPCRTSTCLARDQVVVKAGWRSVSVSIRREVFDAGLKAWVPTAEPGSRQGVMKDAQALVASLQLADLGGPQRAGPVVARPGACPDISVCPPGGCVSER